jgi:general secretion pathway protein A
LQHRDAAAIEGAAPVTRPEPVRGKQPEQLDRAVESKPDRADGMPGPGNSTDSSARDGGGSSPRPSAVPAAEVPKAGEVRYQPTGEGAPGAVPAGPRLAAILADPSLRGSSASSFASLYSHLGIRIAAEQLTAGCNAGVEQGFNCLYRVGNWTKLRYYDLPAILEMTLPSGARSRVTLVGLADKTATLTIGDREYTFPLEEIDSAWDGSFILLWKLPFPARQISSGARGEDVVWVRKTLDSLEGKPSTTAESDLFDESLRQRVMAFQRKQSLPQDGMVGNATLVRLSLAVMGPNAPSLSRHAP